MWDIYIEGFYWARLGLGAGKKASHVCMYVCTCFAEMGDRSKDKDKDGWEQTERGYLIGLDSFPLNLREREREKGGKV